MATKQQVPVLAARLVEFQEEFLILPVPDAQWAITHAKEATALCARAIARRPKGVLRLISSDYCLKLKASDGNRLIHQSKDVFKAYIGPNFIKWELYKPGVSSPEMSIHVHEVIKDSNFMDIFQSLPGSWEQKWLPQDKVIDFCLNFACWLIQKGRSNFFLIKRNENQPIEVKTPTANLAVLRVDLSDEGLGIDVFRLEDPSDWLGEYRHRVISPELMRLKI